MNKEDVGCIHIYIYIYIKWNITQSHKKEWNDAIYSNIDGYRDYHTKRSKPKTNIKWYGAYVESKNNYTNEIIYKAEIEPQTLETNISLPKGK